MNSQLKLYCRISYNGERGNIIFCFTAMLFNIIAVTDFINAISPDSVKFPGSKYIINIILCQLYGPYRTASLW